MSFNSHRCKVLDESIPLSHRASHLRSCLNHVANKLNMSRENLLDKITVDIGVDLNTIESDTDLLLGLEILESLRRSSD
jgi:hypothetical protein